jgi:hypothetical protein
MKLEMGTFPVKNVRFSQQTRYDKETLEINKNELIALVLEDKKVAFADFDVAFLENRLGLLCSHGRTKSKGCWARCVFPGILGSIKRSGLEETIDLQASLSSLRCNIIHRSCRYPG